MNKKISLIIPSVRLLKHWKSYEDNAINNKFNLNDIEVIIIDEDDYELREKNDKILENVDHRFFGIYERRKWFRDHDILNYIDLIPEKCHAETSFGLLLKYQENDTNNLIFQDDDTAATEDDYFGGHINQLNACSIEMIKTYDKWYNLLFDFYQLTNTYARGYPYSERKGNFSILEYKKSPVDVVMNQGFWKGQLDLNANDILPNLDGLTEQENIIFNERSIGICKETYIPICSMNLSFKPEVIPAFYQWDDFRFDDIWSGVIIKKIADHLNKTISNGKPFCHHYKEPRSTFKDIAVESKRLGENEHFWKYVNDTKLTGKTWSECYYEIAEHLYIRSDLFSTTKEYIPIKDYAIKMMQWLDCLEELR